MMTLTLDLPRELEEELSAEAAKHGLPLAEYALRLLYSRQVVEEMPKTGAELVAYWRDAGLVGTRGEIKDSQEYARQLRSEAEMRAQK